jgi:putative membrane protein
MTARPGGLYRRTDAPRRTDPPRRSGSRRRHGPLPRPALLLAGLTVLALVWTAPLERLVPGPFSAYMVMHMGVVAVAAPLLALAVAGGRHDPVRRLPGVFAPVPASVVELLVVWGWHAPALHDAARGTPGALVLEQGMFLASGLLVWLAAFGGGEVLRAERRAAGVVALLLTSMHMTLLGALLALPPRPLYAHGIAGGGLLTPLQDQHLGGAIMLTVGGAAYLAGGLALTFGLLRRPRLGAREAT